MKIEVLYKLKSNPEYINYLHTHSYWYKILIRNPKMINNFIEEVKTNLGLRTTDKISNALSKFEMISSILSSLK